jgi:putative oxidoreductase
MLRTLMRTDDDTAALLLRLVLGIVIFPHGAQKVLGWFGGPGFGGALGLFTQLGVPAALAVLAMAAEFLGSLGLIVGLLSRVAAFGILAVQLGAVLLIHRHVGFFMNWSGQQKGEGFEFALLAMAIAVAIMIKGSGALSLDRAIVERERRL